MTFDSIRVELSAVGLIAFGKTVGSGNDSSEAPFYSRPVMFGFEGGSRERRRYVA